MLKTIQKNRVDPSYFTENWALFVQRYPEFSFFIFPENNPYEFFFSPQQEINLRKKGEKPFYSKQGVFQELKRQFSSEEIENYETIYIYSLGLGYPFFFLHSWLQKNPQKELIFLEEDPHLLYAFLHTKQAKKLILHPQVFIECLFSKSKPQEMKKIACKYVAKHIGFFPSGGKPSSKIATRKKQLFAACLFEEGVFTDRWQSYIHFTHFLQTTRHIQEMYDLNSWKQAFFQVPAIVVGAGPSLIDLQSELSLCTENALILAGGAALAACSNAQIPFHIGTAIDPNPFEFDLLKENLYLEKPLIYMLRTYAKVLFLSNAPSIYAKTVFSSQLEKWWQQKMELEGPFIGEKLPSQEVLSVTALNLAIAQFLGCNPIILAGVDLAYSQDQKKYPEQLFSLLKLKQAKEPLSLEKEIFLESAKGKVRTNLPWILEEKVLSKFASRHKNTQFWEVSPKGLCFSSIPYLPLKELREKYLTKQYDIEGKIFSCLQKSKDPSFFLKQKQVEEELVQSLLRVKQYVDRIAQNITPEGETRGKGAFAEIELPNEIAYQLLFYDTLDQLDLYMRKVDRAKKRNKQEKWRLFSQMIEAFTQYL